MSETQKIKMNIKETFYFEVILSSLFNKTEKEEAKRKGGENTKVLVTILGPLVSLQLFTGDHLWGFS